MCMPATGQTKADGVPGSASLACTTCLPSILHVALHVHQRANEELQAGAAPHRSSIS